MPSYTHGGDVWTHPDILDFSANLHPLGMPPEVAEAAREAVACAIHYPDPMCRELRQAIARRDGVRPEQVICAAGAAELIFRLCQTLGPRQAMVTAPTFSEYEQALALTGCTVKYFPLSEKQGFDLDDAILEAIGPGLELLFLCTPNNPTGRLIAPELLERVAARCAGTGTRLVLDECFLELAGGRPMTYLLEKYPNLFLLRAFTKTFAIPGLRLGYGLSADRALLEGLYAGGQPWGVSTVAQAAGLAACACADWPEKGREALARERPRLLKGLRNLGLTVWEGQANYLLFRAEGVLDLKERMLERGVLLRSCANYRGLGPDYYRVCVRLGPENDILLQRLKEVL